MPTKPQTSRLSFATGFTPVVYGLLHYASQTRNRNRSSANAFLHRDKPGGVSRLRTRLKSLELLRFKSGLQPSSQDCLAVWSVFTVPESSHDRDLSKNRLWAVVGFLTNLPGKSPFGRHRGRFFGSEGDEFVSNGPQNKASDTEDGYLSQKRYGIEFCFLKIHCRADCRNL